MDYAMPVAWGQDSRGFWTHRKKTALGLLVVLAVLAGLATAFTLFDQVVGNNIIRNASRFDYQVWKKEPFVGDEQFRQTGEGTLPVFEATHHNNDPEIDGKAVEMYPGDTRTAQVKIVNTNVPARRDATFYVYIDAILVKDANGGTVPANDSRWAPFVNFWALKVEREKVVASSRTEPADKSAILNEDDHTGQNAVTEASTAAGGKSNPDDSDRRQYATACEGPIRQIFRATACNLGTVRKAGATDVAGESTDQRFYKFNLTQLDSGTDQSAFKGWNVTFTLVFQAQIPALKDPEFADDSSR